VPCEDEDSSSNARRASATLGGVVSVTQEMVSALRLLGLRSGSVVLVHSSLRSLGLGPQGAELLWDALRKAVGDDGTILVPTLSYENVTKERPLFDARTTPACVGAFPEWVRQQRGVLRSVHPTHSVAGLGPDCPDILSGHRDDELRPDLTPRFDDFATSADVFSW
jgi:aminoglycoside 3-N-acetyltransferase